MAKPVICFPSITSDVPKDLRMFCDRVREAVNGGGADSLVSVRQLVAAGVVEYSGSEFTRLDDPSTAATPSAPLNVGAAGAIANIMVTWDKPIYNGHAYAEIWSAARTTAQESASPPEDPSLGQAVLVGMAPGVFFAHSLGAAADRWYWVRFVNVLGEAGPYQSTDGVAGATSVDPAYMLEILTGAITENELYTSLGTRIDLIDAADTVAGSVSQRIGSAVAVEASTRQNADDSITAKYTVKIDVGGHVTGYGLIAQDNDGTPASEFGIRADQFFLAPPTVAQNAEPSSSSRYKGMSWVDTNNSNQKRYWSGSAWVVDSPSLPFIVRTSPTTINGESVPAGVYIRDGYIQNGTIANAQIGNAAVDGAKIATAAIQTAHIADAQITSAKIGNAEITNANIATGTITSANIQNGAIDTADIASAAITLALIDTATITNLSSVSADMGTITAGKLKSSDNKFVIDLNNKSISIET